MHVVRTALHRMTILSLAAKTLEFSLKLPPGRTGKWSTKNYYFKKEKFSQTKIIWLLKNFPDNILIFPREKIRHFS